MISLEQLLQGVQDRAQHLQNSSRRCWSEFDCPPRVCGFTKLLVGLLPFVEDAGREIPAVIDASSRRRARNGGRSRWGGSRWCVISHVIGIGRYPKHIHPSGPEDKPLRIDLHRLTCNELNLQRSAQQSHPKARDWSGGHRRLLRWLCYRLRCLVMSPEKDYI